MKKLLYFIILLSCITLFACSEMKFIVAFDSNGGTYVAPIELRYGENIPMPEEPTKEGYTFVGWYYGNEEWDFQTLFITGEITLVAKWEEDKCNVSFDSNGGTNVESISVQKGKTIHIPETPEKEGYTFIGWYHSNKRWNFSVDCVEGDMTLTAQWVINSYVINFNTNGGSKIESIIVEYGSKIELPENPTKEGFAFAGWDQEIPEIMPAKDITLVAIWGAETSTIIFDTDGGSVIAPVIGEHDSIVITPENPTKEGYTFVGWDQEIPSVMPSNDLTIKAIWQVNQYTIIFNTNGGSIVDNITADYNSIINTPTNPVKEGYTFIGWDQEIPSVMPLNGLVINAIWEPLKDGDVYHTVTFDLNGGSLENELGGEALYTIFVNTYRNGWSNDTPQFADVVIKESVSTYFFATKIFLVYNASINSYEVVEKAPADGKSSLQSATSAWTHCLLYVSDAEYENIQVGQHFVADTEIYVNCPSFNFKVYNSLTKVQTEFIYTEDVSELPVPIKDGFKFIGWFNGETKIETITIGTESLTYTLVAQWEEIINDVYYTITYELDGGLFPEGIEVPYQYNDGSIIQLPKPIKESLVFLGWKTSLDSNEIISSINGWKTDLTLYAVWGESRLYVGQSFEYNTLQAAIDAANDGDTIIVMPGEYEGAIINKSLIIESLNWSTNLNAEHNTSQTVFTSDLVFAADNITVKGVVISGAARFTNALNMNVIKPTMQFCVVRNSTTNSENNSWNAPFFFTTGDNFEITDLTILNCRIEDNSATRPMIATLTNVNGLTIKGCEFLAHQANYNDGIKARNDGGENTAPNPTYGVKGNVTITGNYFQGYAQYLLWFHSYGAGNYVIENNTFDTIGSTTGTHGVATFVNYVGTEAEQVNISIKYNKTVNCMFIFRMEAAAALTSNNATINVNYNSCVDCYGDYYIKNTTAVIPNIENNYWGTSVLDAFKFYGSSVPKKYYTSAEEVPSYGEEDENQNGNGEVISPNPDGTYTVTISEAINENANLKSHETSAAAYTITATVVSITEEYNSENQTISFYISDGISQILVSRANVTETMNISINDVVTIVGQINYKTNNYILVNPTVISKKEGSSENIINGKELILEEYALTNGWTNGTEYPTIMFDEYTMLTSSGSPSCGKYYTSDNSWRLYQTSNASLSITSTKTIDYVIIRYLSQASGVLIYNEDNVLIGEKVYVNSKEITFIVGNALTNKTGQARITSIVIAYAGEENVTSFEVSNIPSNGIALYDTYQLEWKFSGLNGLNQELEFISGNEEVFTIDKNGLISAVGIGEAELFVSVLGNPNINATYTIKVYSSNYFKIEYENEYYVNIGETISISAVYIQGGKEIADLNWESLNPEIAIVENGVVTGISEGEVIIRISYEDNYYDLSISVVDSTQVVVNYDLNGGVFSDTFYAFVDEFAEEIVALFNANGKSNAAVTTREDFVYTTHTNIKYVFSQAENLEKYKWLIQLALDAVNEGTTGDYVTAEIQASVAEMLTKMLAGDTEAINGSYADGRTAFRQFIHRLINISGTEGNTVYNSITYDFSKTENMAKVFEIIDLPVQDIYNENTYLKTPIREGYTFLGWFDENGNKVEWIDVENSKLIINLEAQWKVNSILNISLQDKTVIYDGNEHTIDLEGDLPSDLVITYQDKYVDAGVYTVKVMIQSQSVFIPEEQRVLEAKLIIEKREIAVKPILDETSRIYDGEAYVYDLSRYQVSVGNIVERDINSGLAATYSIMVKILLNNTGEHIEEVIDSGEYYIYAIGDNGALDRNYTITYSSDEDVIYTIEKREITVKPILYETSRIYDGEAYVYDLSRYQVSVGNIVYRDINSGLADTYSLIVKILLDNTGEHIEKVIDSGEYYIYAIGDNGALDRNYTITYSSDEDVIYTIEKREITIQAVLDETSKVYDGLEFVYDSKKFNVIDGSIIERDIDLLSINVLITLDGIEVTEVIDSGEYYIYAIGDNGELDRNYSITYSSDQDVIFSII